MTSTSSAPMEPGGNLADFRQQITKKDQLVNVLQEFFGEEMVRQNPHLAANISANTYQSYAQNYEFERMVVRTYNALEKLDGWWTRVAPFRTAMKHNQQVTVNLFPKRALTRTPEEVPPDMWTHSTQAFSFAMDRYSASFEILGDFQAYGAGMAADILTNKAANVISGTYISLKMKITATLQRMRIPWWIRQTTSNPQYNSIMEASAFERNNYCSLTRLTKGLYGVVQQANKMTSTSGFTFNTMVVPFGTLDPIARNNFHTEAFRSGDSNAMQFLALGARKLKDSVSGIEIYEDAKWNLANVPQEDMEAFLHYTMHGGWIYNRGNENCGPNDNPTYKYGFHYLHAGRKNWAEKLLLQIFKESNRHNADGSLHNHHWELARKWDEYCRHSKLMVYDILDPYLYKVQAGVDTSGSVKPVFAVATKMGEVDPRFSPMEKIGAHVEKMRSVMRSRMSQQDVEAIVALESISKELTDVDRLDVSMQGFVVGIAMDPENRREGASPFLKASNMNSAPMPVYTQPIAEVTDANNAPVTGLLANEAKKVMYFMEEGQKYYICVVNLAANVDNLSRGEAGSPYMYVGIPDNDPVFDITRTNAGNWRAAGTDAERAAQASPHVSKGTTAWKMWGNAQITTDLPVNSMAQGFQPPRLVPAPEKPYFYGAINGLRTLASMYKNQQHRGWDQEQLRKCYVGVTALDKFLSILYDIYTELNLYFDRKFVPLHMKTGDATLDRLNTAASALWGEYYRPFLVKDPVIGEFVNGNYYVSVGSPDFLNARGTSSATIIAQLTTSLARAGVGNGIAAISALSVMLETGMLEGTAREILLSPAHMAKMSAAFPTYAGASYLNNVLQTRDPVLYRDATVANKSFRMFFDQELKADADQATALLNGDVPDPKTAATLLLRVALKLKKLLVVFADNEQLNFNITRQWLDSVNDRASGEKTSFASVESRKGETTDAFARKLTELKTRSSVRIEGENVVARSMDESLSAIWVNTRLSVSSRLWDGIRANLSRDLGTYGNKARAMLRNLNIVIRPMNPADAGIPLAGQMIPEALYNEGVATDDENVPPTTSAVQQQFEYASFHLGSRRGELFGSSYSSSGGNAKRRGPFEASQSMRTNISGLEDSARRLTNSLLERTQNRSIPDQFVTQDSSSSSERMDIRSMMSSTEGASVIPPTRPSYMVGVADVNSRGRIVETYIEPIWLKYRMDHIHQAFENDSFGRIYASLYCFSPNHMKVIERFLANGIAPYGVGHVQTRPFIKDITGAVLFAVGGDSGVAESGMEAPISHITLDGPHNRWYVYWSVWLGCAIYQPDKFMWVMSQVMRKNIGGLTGEMYDTSSEFSLQSATRPTKSGFMIAVGDNLKFEEIHEPISIISQYSMERYGSLVSDRSTMSPGEQHLIGLLYTISMHKLWNLNRGVWNVRGSFMDEKNNNEVNTLCFSEDCMLWDSQRQAFERPVAGNWHYAGIVPKESAWLDGLSILGSETQITNFKG